MSDKNAMQNKENELNLEDLLKKAKDGLFGVLFICNKNSEENEILTWVEMIIDHAQDLSFALLANTNWQSEMKWFQVIVTYFTPEHLVPSTDRIVFTTLIVLLAFVLLNTLWVGYSFSKNNFRYMWTLRLLRATLGLFATILYIPILSIFTRIFIQCSPSGDYLSTDDLVKCWSGLELLVRVGTLVVTLIFIVVVIAVVATMYEPDPKTKAVLSRPHSRFELLYVGFRTVLTVSAQVMEIDGKESTWGPWVISVVSVFSALCLVWCYTWV
ncbi:hypothetical protein HK096_000876 [Nowakowskiella sp. JEL0078]|nr:hypothetical protein HK096_000876 [Nowakowskiella sp. JEL0078]